jgi:hypothetical protein
MSMVLILLFASCLTGLSGRAEAETDDIDVMEVRIFLKEGKIIDVKGITRKELGENYQSTGTYNEKMDEVLDDLREQRGIRHSMSVLFQHNSPPCSYWTFEWTKKGYKKVCLY